MTCPRLILFAILALGFLPASAHGELVADYRFDGSLNSSVANAPALTHVGTGNAFTWENFGPTPNGVVTFPAGNGLRLPLSGFLDEFGPLYSAVDYSIIVEFRFTNVDGYRRVLNFRDPGGANATDDGLYTFGEPSESAALTFYDGAAGSGDHLGVNKLVAPDQYVEVALTRASTTDGEAVAVYANGTLELTYSDDLFRISDLSANEDLWFFKDNANNEHSGGAVSRIRIYNTPLSGTEVAAIAAQNDPPPPDGDGDGVYDHLDNCPAASNAGQADFDNDSTGDACDDLDADGVVDATDNCRSAANADQANSDSDALGNACDDDDDNDGVLDVPDNCPTNANAGQADRDSDGQGDACDDGDGDGVVDASDNCVTVANSTQANLDSDAQGDVCDADDDGDGVADTADNCASVANAGQPDIDSDGQGDACDGDDDGDGLPDTSDNCAAVGNAGQGDLDSDGQGDVCDVDDDADGVPDASDNCATVTSASQADTDGDGQGNDCDSDDDGDGVADTADSCPLSAVQIDTDGDGLADPCDPDDDGDGIPDTKDACPLVIRLGSNGCPPGIIRRNGRVRTRRAGKRGVKVATGFTGLCALGILPCPAGGSISVATAAGGSAAVERLGRAKLTIKPGTSKKYTIKLSKKGAARLRKAGKLRVLITVTLKGADGVKVTAKRRATIKQP